MRIFLILILILGMAIPAAADGWKMTLNSGPHVPATIFAIDKGEQQFMLFEHKSPLHLVKELPCTTGQALGDKLVRGDLRTPEGVYFLGPRIRRSLDWALYGDIAYSLNYPNPIDRIKGKTGSGIWLHGRGKTLVPRDTLGCIALTVPDIKSIGGDTRMGTPVVIGTDVEWGTGSSEEADAVADRVREWANDWQAQSERFFELYDANKFTLSDDESFSHFRKHKEGIFQRTPWIHVMVDGIRVLQGPDYWVTWFDQFYRSPALTQTVGKRLYWQKDASGQLTVVGREYTSPRKDLLPEYLQDKSDEAIRFVEQWATAWRNADMKAYAASYKKDAVSGSERGIASIKAYKKGLWEQKPPVKVDIDNIHVDLHPAGLRVRFLQKYEDASGYSDTGLKTLVLSPDSNSWKIVREDWRRR